MSRKVILRGSVILLFAGAAGAAGAASTHKLAGHQYLKQAQVSPQTARVTALKTYPGHIVSEELEHESGGSGLRYSFDIRHGNQTHEVGVDAKTGRVLENSKEGPNAD